MMKLQAALVFLSLAVSVFLPATLHFPVATVDTAERLLSLDVCNGPGPVISVGAEAPALPEYYHAPMACGPRNFVRAEHMQLVPSLLCSLIEQPPRG